MNFPIPYGKQNITEDDISAVVEVLKGDFLTQGPKVDEFEQAFAQYVGSKYAVAVCNGTAALHLSVLATLNVSGKMVITTPITFAATANSIRYCGGVPLFADIDPTTYLIDINSVRHLLESTPSGSIVGMILVDFAGRSVDLEAFRELADFYGIWIIEDACHAPGSSFLKSNGDISYCGSCEFTEFSIFSLHPVKHIAAGEGGIITTNNFEAYEFLLAMRSHGIRRNSISFKNSLEFVTGSKNISTYPLWYMEMQELGYNYRLTDIQAALGLSQLKRAGEGLNRRREIAYNYFTAFKHKSFIVSQSEYIDGHAYHLYIIEVEDRNGLYDYLRNHNIITQVHYIPCHLMPYYQDLGWKEGDLPKAEKYYKRCLTLPIYPTLRSEEQMFVIEKVSEFFEKKL